MNCFAFRNYNSKIFCNALKKMDCDGCSFYKTREQVEEDEVRSWDRLEEMGYLAGVYPLKFKEVK